MTLSRQTRAERAITQLLTLYDPHPEREGLCETPARVARMWGELLTPKPFKFTVFPSEGADQMVVVRDIPFYSLCEHHVIPFFGHATVAYVPDGTLVGLSKLARVVDQFSHALQTQERITNQVADFLDARLHPLGVGVVLHAQHLCMAMRGVQKPGAITVTSALRGVLLTKPEARSEFLDLARKPG